MVKTFHLDQGKSQDRVFVSYRNDKWSLTFKTLYYNFMVKTFAYLQVTILRYKEPIEVGLKTVESEKMLYLKCIVYRGPFAVQNSSDSHFPTSGSKLTDHQMLTTIHFKMQIPKLHNLKF